MSKIPGFNRLVRLCTSRIQLSTISNSLSNRNERVGILKLIDAAWAEDARQKLERMPEKIEVSSEPRTALGLFKLDHREKAMQSAAVQNAKETKKLHILKQELEKMWQHSKSGVKRTYKEKAAKLKSVSREAERLVQEKERLRLLCKPRSAKHAESLLKPLSAFGRYAEARDIKLPADSDSDVVIGAFKRLQENWKQLPELEKEPYMLEAETQEAKYNIERFKLTAETTTDEELKERSLKKLKREERRLELLLTEKKSRSLMDMEAAIAGKSKQALRKWREKQERKGLI